MKIITDDGQEFTVEEFRTANINPGDIVIFRTPENVSGEQLARIKHIAKPEFPNNQVIVLPGELDIEILRQKAKPTMWCPECKEAMDATYSHDYHLHKLEDGNFEPHRLREINEEPYES